MTNPPSKTLSDHANDIYVAIIEAQGDGFRLRVTKHGYLDLVDADDDREPIASVTLED